MKDGGGFNPANRVLIDGEDVTDGLLRYETIRREGDRPRVLLEYSTMELRVVGDAGVRILLRSHEVSREMVDALREAFECSGTGQSPDRQDLAEKALEALEALFPDPPDDSTLDAEDVGSAGSDPATV